MVFADEQVVGEAEDQHDGDRDAAGGKGDEEQGAGERVHGQQPREKEGGRGVRPGFPDLVDDGGGDPRKGREWRTTDRPSPVETFGNSAERTPETSFRPARVS